MRKIAWFATCCVFLFVLAGVGVFGLLRSELIARRTDINVGRFYLKRAYETYLKDGRIPKSDNAYYEMWLCTDIVRVGETEYQCCLAGRFGKRFGDGTLVLTTNHIYVWMTGGKPIKIIGDDYKPQFFPPAF